MPGKVLIIGGSGFLSGAVTRAALGEGHRVSIVTRGQRPLPSDVAALTADRRDRAGFAAAIAAAKTTWDLVIDCIGFEPGDARQDLEVFQGRAAQLVFVSTDFVFDPAHRTFPQPEHSDYYLADGYGGKKRLCEEVLLADDAPDLLRTIIRPCHIYGPGSRLGCLPAHGRDPELIDRLRRGEALQLVAGGIYLQQPILAGDLAAMLLSVMGNEAVAGAIFNAAGPEIVESVDYYRQIAEHLGTDLQVEELPLHAYRDAHPEHASFLCHRIYDLAKLRTSGLAAPATPLGVGLREHVEWLMGQ